MKGSLEMETPLGRIQPLGFKPRTATSADWSTELLGLFECIRQMCLFCQDIVLTDCEDSN